MRGIATAYNPATGVDECFPTPSYVSSCAYPGANTDLACVRINTADGSASCQYLDSAVDGSGSWTDCAAGASMDFSAGIDAGFGGSGGSGPYDIACAYPGGASNLACTRVDTATGATSCIQLDGAVSSASGWFGCGDGVDNAPDAFSFMDQINVATSTVITSDSVTLSGFDGPQTATGSAGVEVERNGNGTWNNSIAGFMPGDTIRIRMTSSSSYSTAVTGTVTVGSTTSGTWSVTTTACQTGDTSGGGICADCSCSLIAAATHEGAFDWKSFPDVTPGADSHSNGAANTAAMVADDITDHPAGEACVNKTTGSYNDWYLPARNQLDTLYDNRIAIGGFVSAAYWSSTEWSSDTDQAFYRHFSDGSAGVFTKNAGLVVRCVRTP